MGDCDDFTNFMKFKEVYVVNVQDTRKKKIIQSGNFTLKDDANKYIKDMLKKNLKVLVLFAIIQKWKNLIGSQKKIFNLF